MACESWLHSLNASDWRLGGFCPSKKRIEDLWESSIRQFDTLVIYATFMKWSTEIPGLSKESMNLSIRITGISAPATGVVSSRLKLQKEFNMSTHCSRDQKDQIRVENKSKSTIVQLVQLFFNSNVDLYCNSGHQWERSKSSGSEITRKLLKMTQNGPTLKVNRKKFKNRKKTSNNFMFCSFWVFSRNFGGGPYWVPFSNFRAISSPGDLDLSHWRPESQELVWPWGWQALGTCFDCFDFGPQMTCSGKAFWQGSAFSRRIQEMPRVVNPSTSSHKCKNTPQQPNIQNVRFPEGPFQIAPRMPQNYENRIFGAFFGVFGEIFQSPGVGN